MSCTSMTICLIFDKVSSPAPFKTSSSAPSTSTYNQKIHLALTPYLLQEQQSIKTACPASAPPTSTHFGYLPAKGRKYEMSMSNMVHLQCGPSVPFAYLTS